LTKIAIYGDSFAADFEGWPKYFGKLMKCEVKTFAYGSTSIAYSYLKFIETHEKYDIVYFLWTDTLRNWLISTPNEDDILEHQVCFIPSWSRGDSDAPISKDDIGMSNKNISIEDQKLISKWIISENRWSEIFKNKNLLSVIAMRDSVKHRRPDCFNIESFDYFKTKKNRVTLDITPGMWRIPLQDMMQYSNEWLNEDSKSEKKFNHLSKIQNQEFAQYLFESYKNKDFDIHKTFENPKKYYTMSKTLKESGFAL